MKRKRRKRTAEFKARVASEAIRGLKTQNEIAKEFEIHSAMVGQWKNELFECMVELFACKADKDPQTNDKEKVRLKSKVGQLTIDVDFLEKSASSLGFR